MSSTSLMIIPLVIMIFLSIVNIGVSQQKYQTQIKTGNYTVNQGTEGVTTSPISLATTTVVTALIIGFIALAVAISLHVFGSGVGEFGVRTFIIGGLALALWAFLSTLSFNFFTDIPVFGLIIYFLLSICYAVGTIRTIGGLSE